MAKTEKTLEEQLGVKYGVSRFTMTDVQENGKVKIGFAVDGLYEVTEVEKDVAIMILAAFEGGKEWMREEFRLLLNVQEKTWRSG